MNIFYRTNHFDEWLDNLKDFDGKRRIEARIKNAIEGNFGIVDSVGDGVYEIKFKTLGYRLYYCQSGKIDYLLLIGGDKNTKKEQTRDIDRAKEIKREVERSDKW
jgi:putative addiction module killer protein